MSLRTKMLWSTLNLLTALIGLKISDRYPKTEIGYEINRMLWIIIFTTLALTCWNQYGWLPFSPQKQMILICGFSFAYYSIVYYYGNKYGFNGR